MTYKQFLRWESFSIRMSEHCYPEATKARGKKITEEVVSFFEERRFQKDWPKIMDWDGNKDDFYLSDNVDDSFERYRHWSRREGYWTGRFYTQVTCCIRAGFDIAVDPSGGVVGFTAGDIRRMWQKVPRWVKRHWKSFDAIPDAGHVWL